MLVSHAHYLDESGQASAGRSLALLLASRGLSVAALSGTVIEADGEVDPDAWAAARGHTLRAAGGSDGLPLHDRLDDGGVSVVLHRGPTSRPHDPGDAERREFLRLLDDALARTDPEVLVGFGGGSLIRDAFSRARAWGVPTVLVTRDCRDDFASPLAEADAAVSHSRFAAGYFLEAFGVTSTPLPLPASPARGVAGAGESRYLTFVDPTAEAGVSAFARIAAELSRLRPDIPLLVVEGRSTAADLAAAGLDLRAHGGPGVMPAPAEPDDYWELTRVALVPALAWDAHPAAAAAALARGVPVLGSDRGGLPEMVGGAGVILPLPQRLTPATRVLATAEEVAPWVEAVIRLWDDAEAYDDLRRKARVRARLWAPEVVGALYARALDDLIAAGPARGLPGADAAVKALAGAYSWPAERPAGETLGLPPGWLGAGTDLALADSLSPRTRLVVELGAWLGMSARFIADHAPAATVVSVDHWKGSSEHRDDASTAPRLITLYDGFLSRSWDYRDRIIPLRATTLEGLRIVAERGLNPDVIYIDAEHTYRGAAADVALAHRLFPRATLVGDDYDWEGVARAVDEFAGRHGLEVIRVGHRGWRLAGRPRDARGIEPAPPGRVKAVALVPYDDAIVPECEQALDRLERAGVRVVRRRTEGKAAATLDRLVSDALHDGVASMLLVGPDISFDPADALRLLARPEPVLAGVYAREGRSDPACTFARGSGRVVFGPDARWPYPLAEPGSGFLRIRAGVLRRMVRELGLPLCDSPPAPGVWPFFQSAAVPRRGGGHEYLGEDRAFSYRLTRIGVVPLADTSVRLSRHGRHAFACMEAGDRR